MKRKKIYIPCLLPYPFDTVPGQRFRWEQWEIYLKKLITNRRLIHTMGICGRKTVRQSFSNISIINRLSSILRL